jgi:hypothetical protein
MRSPSNEEWNTRMSQLQETLAVCPADLAARNELATLFERLDHPQDALLSWSAILISNPNNLKAREGAARCRGANGVAFPVQSVKEEPNADDLGQSRPN